mgnify:CR=1 FL=1
MDEYLKLLLEQIRCTKARPYIKQELQDHMEDQIAENMKAGMDHEQAEKEAVRDMGDPVETGISLDSIHRPQAAWKLLGMIILISIAGVLIHAGISGKASENAVAGSDRYVFHVMIGLAVMMILYLLDYTVLAKFSKISCFIVRLFAGYIGRRPGKRSKDFYITARRQKRHGCTKTDAVLCPHIWSNFI